VFVNKLCNNDKYLLIKEKSAVSGTYILYFVFDYTTYYP